jgi:mannose-6-phosphate isomerase-like protein (cupin superfamily)
MATTENSYRVVPLDDVKVGLSFFPEGEAAGRERLDVRGDLGISAFGINAVRIPGAGALVREHTEVAFGADGQEELYIVLNGSATFVLDGEEVETPAGSLVYVRPEVRRSAVASHEGTTLLIVGGTPGRAYEVPPTEAEEAFAAYNAGDFETAVEKQRAAVKQVPENLIVLFNLACFEARAGKTDDAIQHLQAAVEADRGVVELARDDTDLDSLREDPRFKKLVA